MTLYWKSTCTTCREARSLVRGLRPDVTDRNYAREPLLAGEIQAILAAAGSVSAVLNSRHAIAKERGWKEHSPDVTTFVQAVLAEPNLLRRPILVDDDRAVVGNDEAALRAMLS